MAAVRYTMSANGDGILHNKNVSLYYRVGIGTLTGSTTPEINHAAKTPAGSFSNLFMYVHTNGITGGATSCTLRDSGAGTALSISIAASTTGAFEDTDSHTVDAGDTMTINASTHNSGSNMQYAVMAVTFSSSSDTKSVICANAATVGSAAYGKYHGFGGGYQNNTNEGTANTKAKATFTADKLSTYISANTFNQAVSIQFRKNTANGNQALSVTASTTGWFDDGSGSDSLTANDTFCLYISASAGTGSCTVRHIATTMTSTSAQMINGSNSSSAISVPSGSTNYSSLAGEFPRRSTAADVQTKIKAATTLSKLQLISATNSTSSSGTVKSYINSSQGNLSISLPSGASGNYSDDSSSDSLADGDLVCWQIIAPGGGGAVGYSNNSSLMTTVTTAIKTIQGLAKASVKTVESLAIASVKTVEGLA